jgi:hypothetical protein
MSDSRAPTHTAFTRKREGRRHRWIGIGTGRIEPGGVFHVILETTPIGGFDGYVYMAPIGVKPPEVEPERPGGASESEDA